jgi:hypothetical protein
LLTSSDLCKVLGVKSEASWNKPSSRLVAAVLLLILPLLYFYPVLTGEVALVQGDGWAQNLGVRVLLGRMIAAGQLPLWNPYIFGGMPLLASIYPGVLYPPNWLFAVFSPGTAMNLVVITTYHIALIGTYLYGRRIGMTRSGAIVSGAIFTFSGYMISHLGHTSRIAAAAWLPWILLAVENLYHQLRWRWIIGGAAFVALQLFAGEPQMTFYTVLVVGAYALFSLLLRECPSRVRFAAATAIMSAGGLLLSMIQLLPERELLRQGERAAISYEYFSGYSFPPRQILAFLFPFFFGGSPRVFYWGQWSAEEMCGYAGLLALLLSLVAIFARRNKPQIWFWALIATVSLILAFGDFLPFHLNRVLYRLPIYNLFRASARHLYEFTFALGVLAGLGMTYLAQSEAKDARRAFVRGAALFVLVFVVATIIYRFSGSWLVTATPRPAGSESLLAREGLAPIVFFVISLSAVCLYSLSRTKAYALVLVALTFADLFYFGHSIYWREERRNINTRLSDPQTVALVKERERDLNSFRIVSHKSLPFYALPDEMLNFPNASIARGLQSVNGYDALRLPRPAELAGGMTIDGEIEDLGVFADEHQGLNLLNVKYLFRTPPAPISEGLGVELGGIRFERSLLNWNLKPGARISLTPAPAYATSISLVTTMANATHVPNDAPVARITLRTEDGRTIERLILAGRDTSEWAYDREPSRMLHRRATIAETWNDGGFDAHRYLSKFEFPRTKIVATDFEYLLPDASLIILRASYIDQQNGVTVSAGALNPSSTRWKKIATFASAEVYENLKVMPRAWFVSRVVAAPSEEVAQAIKTGVLKDGTRFEPAETALFEKGDFGGKPIALPPVGETTGAEARVVVFEPQRIVIETDHTGPGFLVLSEIWYRGWEAWVDGTRVPVERVDYSLRGLPVNSGKHRVEMVFRAHSFRTGAVYSGLGVLGLLGGALFTHLRRRRSIKYKNN